jgi:hypothetical protein
MSVDREKGLVHRPRYVDDGLNEDLRMGKDWWPCEPYNARSGGTESFDEARKCRSPREEDRSHEHKRVRTVTHLKEWMIRRGAPVVDCRIAWSERWLQMRNQRRCSVRHRETWRIEREKCCEDVRSTIHQRNVPNLTYRASGLFFSRWSIHYDALCSAIVVAAFHIPVTVTIVLSIIFSSK